MVSMSAKVSFRVGVLIAILVAAFYVGRPLYWKLSATIHEIREKRQTVQQGISQFVLEAQRSVGWVRDDSRALLASNRRILSFDDVVEHGRL